MRAVVFVVLGIVGGVLAEIGDLAASRIKRTMNIKDFGNISPVTAVFWTDLTALCLRSLCFYGIYVYVYVISRAFTDINTKRGCIL